ncbi:hypothetical protein GUJ93_ZPchr0004g40217 [Zizania palustris]|uniref:Uncharacterized protein n=1 Tax=Zizania palustris TaxID=103762 RepID=A0A8J5S6R3_ZIZPA|nr:hypothetical protein GUJ93_ZPchr0004g40217 [Zizania palustris]
MGIHPRGCTPMDRGICPRGSKPVADRIVVVRTTMTRTHLTTERENDLGCDASALGGGSPNHPNGGTGSLDRTRSGDDGSVGHVNSVAEASATSLTAQINEQLGAAGDGLRISPAT